jgi:hypothetical protein
VWHGSPHKFDKFDSSKMGTGEGAQAYGYGSPYLADARDVGESYARMEFNSYKGNPHNFSKDVWAKTTQEKAIDEVFQLSKAEGLTASEAIQKLLYDYKEAAKQTTSGHPELMRNALKKLDPKKFVEGSEGGYLYKVDLPDSMIAKMLDWDKPISRQAPEVREAVSRAFPGTYVNGRFVDPVNSQLSGRALFDQLTEIANKRGTSGMRTAEATLQKAGVPGNRYLDGGSRSAGQGSSNYVIFPGGEDALTILERNGVILNGIANLPK